MYVCFENFKLKLLINLLTIPCNLIIKKHLHTYHVLINK